MITLGISCRAREAASAIAIDGVVRAAISEASCRGMHNGRGSSDGESGGFPLASVLASLHAAGVDAKAVDRIVVCRPEEVTGSSAAMRPSWRQSLKRNGGDSAALARTACTAIGELQAHAAQLLAVDASRSPEEASGVNASSAPMLVVDGAGRGHAAVFEATARDLKCRRSIEHFARATSFVQRAAAALGIDIHGDDDSSEASMTAKTDRAVATLQMIGLAGQPVYLPRLQRGMWFVPGAGIESAPRLLTRVLAEASADASGQLGERRPLHLQVRNTRANFAASVTAWLADMVVEIAEDAIEGADDGGRGLPSSPSLQRTAVADAKAGQPRGEISTSVSAGGSLVSHYSVAGALHARFGDRISLAPVPGALGVAVGAALSGSLGAGASVGPALPSNLALGRLFSEAEVKAALDGAHLDYVYEPDWPRIMARASRLLAAGKLVGWFHGAMELSSHSLGARSILSDPSSRYARDNVNRYLRQRPDDPPPPLVMTADAARECLTAPVHSPYGAAAALVNPQFRAQLQAGVSDSGHCRVQTVDEHADTRLATLLRSHRAATGVPGLLQVDLAGPGESPACSPRDALRTTYSTPVDALVIERFVLMKDHWLLREPEAR